MTDVRDTRGTVIGNHYYKYAARNPAIRCLTSRFLGSFERLCASVAAEAPGGRVLEVGCGEGEIARRLLTHWPEVTAIDLPDAGLRDEWRALAGPSFLHADAHHLPFADDAFDVLVSVEVLEHLTDPAAGLREYARVARSHLLLSVPREPLFRLGNLAAGRHLHDLGNTPGHINHWTTPGFMRFVSQVGAIRDLALPLPWTIIWLRLT